MNPIENYILQGCNRPQDNLHIYRVESSIDVSWKLVISPPERVQKRKKGL